MHMSLSETKAATTGLTLPDRGVAIKQGERVPTAKPQETRYPAELVGEVTTRVGTKISVRPIRPDDGPALVDFHQHLSARSVYRRFFSVHPNLSVAEIERFTCVDYVDRLALIAHDDDRLIAVGRYDRTLGTPEAEVAFVVADEFQHHGIGTFLLERLADAAWHCGITTFVALTQAENREMLGVFVDSGFDVSTSFEDGVISIRFAIAPDDMYQAACAARASGD
jgi:GNAT superfamily N-acetyltransferase